MNRAPTILLSCGEASGDQHAAAVVRRLLGLLPGARVCALGGDRCREAGADVIHHYSNYAILGFSGVVSNLPRLWRLERSLRRRIREGTDLFVAVDYPGLNLRLAAAAKRAGVPVLYYISPQVWAWGERRIPRIRRVVDRMAVILPFEVDFYRRRGMDVEFVGHPFVADDELPASRSVSERAGIALLPGSREQEVRRILPLMLEAARSIALRRPDVQCTVAAGPSVDSALYRDIMERKGIRLPVETDAVSLMGRSRAAAVASGTATLQTALMGTPLVVVYRVSPLNYALARRLVTVADIGLVNVVLGDRVCPEFIQGGAKPARLAGEVLSLHDDGEARDRMLARFASLEPMLSGGGGAGRVAELAAELLSGSGWG